MDSELRYIQLIFRRWWLILLAVILAGGASFAFRLTRPPAYTADARMIIGNIRENPNPGETIFATAEQLAAVYVQIASREDILQRTIDEFDLDMTTEELDDEVLNVRGQLETPFLTISATYTDPQIAADIANFLGDQLILEAPNSLSAEEQVLIETTNSQIALLTDQIEAANTELGRITARLEVATDPDEITRLTDQKNLLVDQITQLSANIASFTETNNQVLNQINEIEFLQRAIPPERQSGISPIVTAVIGGVVGVILALGGILLSDYLDHRIKSSEEGAHLLDAPMLGTIIRYGKKGASNADLLVTNQTTRTAEALEGYRSLQTNLLFSVEGKKRGTFLFTSANPAEGKSLTVANLAITIAASGVRVLLIDADLRKPKQHEVFGLENKPGLVLLAGQKPSQEDKTVEALIAQVLYTHPLFPNLKIMTAGAEGLYNPTQVLGAEEVQAWLDIIAQRLNVEVILFDTPPALAVSDSFVLAATTKADIVMVFVPNSTQRDQARRAKERFEYIGSRFVGLVANRVSPRDVESSYGSTYLLQRLAEGHHPSLNGAEEGSKTAADAAPAI